VNNATLVAQRAVSSNQDLICDSLTEYFNTQNIGDDLLCLLLT
jgi:hypothetical protein